jgi:2-oxoglutarate dehydrogenase complex dehydrogenase (E1) component-like enzyme
MRKAVFYHAGCAICSTAEQEFVMALNPSHYQVEVVHLGTDKSRIAEAESAGIKSVPALLIDGRPFHINFGASLEDVKAV